MIKKLNIFLSAFLLLFVVPSIALGSGGFVTFFGWFPNGSGQWVQNATTGGAQIFKSTADASRGIRTATSDGTDNQFVQFASGGAFATDASRGGEIDLYGNEATGGVGGAITVRAGSGSGAIIYLQSGGTTKWTINNSGVLTQDATSGGNFIMPKTGTGLIVGLSALPSDISSIAPSTSYNFVGVSGFNEVLARGQTTTAGPYQAFAKSRAVDGTADTIVVSGDEIGTIQFLGANGTTFSTAAQIVSKVDGTPGASNDMPGSLDFQVSPDGSGTPASALKLSNTKDAVFGGYVRTSSAAGFFGASADTSTTIFGGGSGTSTANGAILSLAGVTAGGTGAASLSAGNVGGGDVNITASFASRNIYLNATNKIFRSEGGTTEWTMAAGGTLIGAGTATIGWSIQAAANQACTTTCVTPCVMGINTAVSDDIVACSDATADRCLCAGAS